MRAARKKETSKVRKSAIKDLKATPKLTSTQVKGGSVDGGVKDGRVKPARRLGQIR
jgi:hypothetical protein